MSASEFLRNEHQDILRLEKVITKSYKALYDGVAEVNGTKVMVFRMLQGRNPEWVNRPFFAKYDENAIWLDDLKPAFEDKFFFEDELDQIKEQKMKTMTS